MTDAQTASHCVGLLDGLIKTYSKDNEKLLVIIRTKNWKLQYTVWKKRH